MSGHSLSAATWLVIGLVLGAWVSRLWQGDLADAVPVIVTVLAVGWFLTRTQWGRSPSRHNGATDSSAALPGRRLVWRLHRTGRLRYVEFTFSLPNGWSIPRDNLPLKAATEPPAPPLLVLLWNAFRQNRRRATLALVSFGLVGMVLLFLPSMTPQDDYTLPIILWIAAIIIYVVSVLPSPVPNIRWRASRLPIGIALGVIVLLALALRLWQVGTIPFALSGDEASQGLESLRVLRGEIRDPFVTGWYAVPTLSFYFNSLTLGLLGANITALRLPWVLVGTLSVVTTFALVTRLAGLRLGLVTAGLLAVYHYHIHFSRLGSNQIADPLFVSLALYLLDRALARRGKLEWTALGIVCAGSLYFYAGARLAVVLVLTVMAFAFLQEREHFWRVHRTGLVLGLGAFLIVGAPMIQFALVFPDDFNARINQTVIFQSGWLQNEVMVRRTSMEAILIDQFLRAALAFNYYPDRTVWYGLREPLLDPVFATLSLLGMGYASARSFLPRANRRLFPMVAWWWGGVILGGMLTESPPSSQRLITLSVPVCFFIALALSKFAQLGKKAIEGLSVNRSTIIVSLLFAVISLKTYFVDYTPRRIFGSARAEAATMMAPILNPLVSTHRFFFVGAPFMYWSFATLPFLMPDAQVTEIRDPITAPLAKELVQPGEGGVFIIVPERAGELQLIRETWSQGELREIRTPADGHTIAMLYIVPP